MADPFTVKPVYNALSQYIRNRADIGASRAMRDGVLEPSNPFERKGREATQTLVCVVVSASCDGVWLLCLL